MKLFSQKILAKALYDNMAESTDELAFRKGDLLTVIETDLTDSTWLVVVPTERIAGKF